MGASGHYGGYPGGGSYQSTYVKTVEVWRTKTLNSPEAVARFLTELVDKYNSLRGEKAKVAQTITPTKDNQWAIQWTVFYPVQVKESEVTKPDTVTVTAAEVV